MSFLNIIMRCCMFVILLISCMAFSLIQPSNNREYRVKAVFLFNFTQFIEWPKSSFAQPESPFVIGILGNDQFNNYLNEVTLDEKINGHPIVIEHYKNVDEIKQCHILYISSTETDKVTSIKEQLKNFACLTVSDETSFLKKGGMIRFFTKNNKIQLEINPEETKNSNLVVSAKLLKLADIYIIDKK